VRSHWISSRLTPGVYFQRQRQRSIFSATDRKSVYRFLGSAFVNCGKEDGYQNRGDSIEQA